MSAVKNAEGVFRFDVPGRCVVRAHPDQADEEQERPEIHGVVGVAEKIAPVAARCGVASLAAGASPLSLSEVINVHLSAPIGIINN
jgi:hypothetical protein